MNGNRLRVIRSTKVSLKFSNHGKLGSLREFIDEYSRLVSLFVDELWYMDRVPKLLPRELTSKPDTWLSARMRQCASKQASGIVRGTRAKSKRREWQISEFVRLGMLKKARRLKRMHDSKSVSKPSIEKMCPELDSRIVKVDLDNDTSFDGWITVSSVGNGVRLQLPFSSTRHLNRLLESGKMRTGVRMSGNHATLTFDVEVPKKEDGTVLGVDIGLKNVVSCSDGFQSQRNPHGHDLESITGILSRRSKGSNGFRRAVEHRTNYVNWSVNRMNLDDVRQVNIEDIRHLRRGKRTSRTMGHWAYRGILGKLERYCEERGVLVRRINPAYTSQRCSSCGWVRKGNRKGKSFRCDKCLTSMDSDLNASLNLALGLRPIGRKERSSRNNRAGFYWNVAGQEPIVPDARKPGVSYFS